MVADNQPLISLGAHLSKLKSINKQLSSLAEDIFYSMAQAVIPKASLEATSIGGGLIVSGLLKIHGINYNKSISGIPNYIPSPSNLQCLVMKYREAKFMRIVWFVCDYPCSISYDNGDRAGIGRLFK